MMWPGGWQWGAWGWAMMLMMIVFWALVVAAIVYAVNSLSRTQRGWGSPPEDPVQILDRRYARGEITREQYQQMRDDLMRPGGGAPSGPGA